MEQILAESPTSPTREERELQASCPYGMPLVDLRHMLRGRRTTGSDDMFIFVKEGIKKLSDLNTVRGNNTRFILIGGNLWQGLAQLSRNLCHKKIGKRRVQPSPGGLWAVSEQVLRHKQNQAHSGRPVQQDVWPQ